MDTAPESLYRPLRDSLLVSHFDGLMDAEPTNCSFNCRNGAAKLLGESVDSPLGKAAENPLTRQQPLDWRDPLLGDPGSPRELSNPLVTHTGLGGKLPKCLRSSFPPEKHHGKTETLQAPYRLLAAHWHLPGASRR